MHTGRQLNLRLFFFFFDETLVSSEIYIYTIWISKTENVISFSLSTVFWRTSFILFGRNSSLTCVWTYMYSHQWIQCKLFRNAISLIRSVNSCEQLKLLKVSQRTMFCNATLRLLACYREQIGNSTTEHQVYSKTINSRSVCFCHDRIAFSCFLQAEVARSVIKKLITSRGGKRKTKTRLLCLGLASQNFFPNGRNVDAMSTSIFI